MESQKRSEELRAQRALCDLIRGDDSWEDTVVENIEEKYHRLVDYRHVSAMKAESPKVTKRRLSLRTLELIPQHKIARAIGNRSLTSELAKCCREAINEDLKERQAAVMAEAAEARKSIRKAQRGFTNFKTKMIALRYRDATVTASRRAMEKIFTSTTRISSLAMSTYRHMN
ncbi:hypothetical protein KIN20_007805 [Parelaphostrongylus tenuis]|uniref:Uncharacterized protein n=1 Tax=Parelaphostrongylus tenuis TaxID=148309 RepID=A0AAD5MPE0_PARTN|nr:hypothetical protein KIN20_007667 [Parelaphostrongylus tenuis]KAJ1351690.1 hypothetical protein KIN20_007805 [Parelaphostrongylus tenuis]